MPHRDYFKQPKIYATTPREEEQHNYKRLIFITIFLIILIATIWFFFFSSYFQIKKIIISGSVNPEVNAEIDGLKGKNILLFRVGKIEKELAQKQTSISSLEIYKGLPDTIKIKVNVRVPAIAWQTQGKTYLIDANGIVFELGEGTAVDEKGERLMTIIDTKNAPVKIGSQVVTENFIQFAIYLIENLQPKVGLGINELKISETTFQIEAVTDRGWKIYLDTTRDPANQLISLKKIIDEHGEEIKEYIDLRVGGRAYYK